MLVQEKEDLKLSVEEEIRRQNVLQAIIESNSVENEKLKQQVAELQMEFEIETIKKENTVKSKAHWVQRCFEESLASDGLTFKLKLRNDTVGELQTKLEAYEKNKGADIEEMNNATDAPTEVTSE